MKPEALEVADGVLLDPRLALVHPEQNWVAVSDLHLGYEFQKRKHGHLFPDWGSESVSDRLLELGRAYAGFRLILVGDLIDAPSRKLTEALGELLSRLTETNPDLILVRGNHDGAVELKDWAWKEEHEEGGFRFRHGHKEDPNSDSAIRVEGHIHPASVLRDGAGMRIKCPAFIREEIGSSVRWILPAFSPWAGGVPYRSPDPEVSIYLSSGKKVLPNVLSP